MKSRDTVRLDWLTRHARPDTALWFDEEGPFNSESGWRVESDAVLLATGRTPRQAIDAAMRAEKEAGS